MRKACGKRSEPHPNLAAKPPSPLKTRAKKN